MKNKYVCEKGNRIINVLLALFLSFTLFFFAPLEIFFSIYEDVWFDITHIIGLILFVFLSIFCVSFIALEVLGRINKNLCCGIRVLIFSLALAAYFQGNFLMSSFGAMDGDAVDWSSFGVENIVSVIFWLTVVVGCFGLLYYKGETKFCLGAKVVMICIILVQIVTLGTLCITTEGLKGKSRAAFLDKNEFVYSDNKNVIVLLLDMYDSQVFQSIYDEQGGDEYTDMLDGFIYYPDTVGTYSLTYCALPHILTGEKYYPDMDMETYINEAYKKSPLMNQLKENQYDINIYTNEAVPTEKEVYEMISNYLPTEESDIYVSSRRRLLTYMYNLVGIRYLPQPLKKYCWFYSAEMWDLREVNYEDELYALDNFMFYNGMNDIEVNADQKTFHFYHLEGMHVPCYYDENFEKTTTDLSLEGKEGTIRNGKGMLLVVKKFINQLKEKGIYDNCAIVIMADHGGRFLGDSKDTGTNRANPLLLVKGFEESHPLQVSSRAISYDDLQGAFIKLINGEQGENVFPEDSLDRKRVRYFIDAASFTEYSTTERADEVQEMQPVTAK